MYLSLYCKGSKRVTQGLRVRGSWRPNINCNILGPLCWVMAFFNASYLYLLIFFTFFIFFTASYNSLSNWNWNCLTSVLTELYNSSMATRSPTRSLKSHVWSSSSGNNCHAVHRSLSSGASVYECTMGIFLLVPFHLPISTHAISSHNCH